jgi:DNA-binding response OmpR family regulator
VTTIASVQSVLLVEDDDTISEPLSAALEREGYDVAVAETGAKALEEFFDADLVVLDLNLQDVDGVDVCRRIRSERAAVPILMLTARAEELDAVVGLDAGADDYVTKPFRLAELMARVRALLRRAGDEYANEVEVDDAARRAWRAGRELDLTPKEFDLLSLLASERGNVVRRERIMEDVWDEHWFGSTKTLDVHVSSLRRKLGDDPNEPALLTTVRGIGYRLEEDRRLA